MGFAATPTQPRNYLQQLLRQSLVSAALNNDQKDRIDLDIEYLPSAVREILAMGVNFTADIHHLRYVASLLSTEVLDASEEPSNVLFPVMTLQGTRPKKLRRAALQEIARLRDPSLLRLVRTWLNILSRRDPSIPDDHQAQDAVTLAEILLNLRDQRRKNVAAGIVGTNNAATQMLRGRIGALAQGSAWRGIDCRLSSVRMNGTHVVFEACQATSTVSL